MEPTCLTPGCNQSWDHAPRPHGIVEPNAQGDIYAWQKATGYGTASNPPLTCPIHVPTPPVVTLEGLAAVIAACGSAINSVGDWDGKTRADGHLLALIAKAREVAGCKDETEMTAGDAVRAAHHRIAAIPDDELERRAGAIAARDDAAVAAALADNAEMTIYNRAITDAQNVIAEEFDTPSWEQAGVKAQTAIRKLYRNKEAK